jgi:hypothetical protein
MKPDATPARNLVTVTPPHFQLPHIPRTGGVYVAHDVPTAMILGFSDKNASLRSTG